MKLLIPSETSTIELHEIIEIHWYQPAFCDALAIPLLTQLLKKAPIPACKGISCFCLLNKTGINRSDSVIISTDYTLTTKLGGELYSENARVCAKWPWNARDCVTGLRDWWTRECNPVTLSLVRFTVIPHTPVRSRFYHMHIVYKRN